MARSCRETAQLTLPLAPMLPSPASPASVQVLAGTRTFDVVFVRHRRARHYILRVADDCGVRVTIPRAGSRAEAERFIRERRVWIERERYRRALDAAQCGRWQDGTTILFRGTPVRLDARPDVGGRIIVTFADQRIELVPTPRLKPKPPPGLQDDLVLQRDNGAGLTNLRPFVESHLRQLAAREIPARLAELARLHGFTYAAVAVRNQRSRWGSCSPAGRISLNWRLVQLPATVADYVLLHELAHLRHLNHGVRFWRAVERMCPHYREACTWLRVNHGLRPEWTRL
ncbi:MAG: SprT family zinc-dependent metalloprotease [Acidobacteriota bacterium]